MTDELREAKERLRTAWRAPVRPATQNPDVAQAKEGLRSAANSLTRFGISWGERLAVEQLGEWAHQSPWRAVLTAFLTGAVLGGRDTVALYLITRVVDIAAAESLRTPPRTTPARSPGFPSAAASE